MLPLEMTTMPRNSLVKSKSKILAFLFGFVALCYAINCFPVNQPHSYPCPLSGTECSQKIDQVIEENEKLRVEKFPIAPVYIKTIVREAFLFSKKEIIPFHWFQPKFLVITSRSPPVQS